MYFQPVVNKLVEQHYPNLKFSRLIARVCYLFPHGEWHQHEGVWPKCAGDARPPYARKHRGWLLILPPFRAPRAACLPVHSLGCPWVAYRDPHAAPGQKEQSWRCPTSRLTVGQGENGLLQARFSIAQQGWRWMKVHEGWVVPLCWCKSVTWSATFQVFHTAQSCYFFSTPGAVTCLESWPRAHCWQCLMWHVREPAILVEFHLSQSSNTSMFIHHLVFANWAGG